MTAAATPPEDAPGWARPLFERQIAMAGELAEAGLAMALDAKEQALPEDGGVEPAVFEALSRAFARLSRSTRLSLMLQDRLIKELIAFDKGPDTGRDDRAGSVQRIVRIIVDPEHDAEQREYLAREAAERLDRETLDEALPDRPASELVAMICRDIGLDTDGPRLACEAWAKAEAAGGDMGRPLKSSPIGGGGPDEASAKSGGGGMREAGTDGVVPLHQTLRDRSPSPDGGGIERDPVLAPP